MRSGSFSQNIVITLEALEEIICNHEFAFYYMKFKASFSSKTFPKLA